MFERISRVAAIGLGMACLAGRAQDTRIVSTFAGTDWILAGAGRPAVETPFGTIGDVTVSPRGEVAFVDTDSSMVFRLLPDGTVQAAAGNGLRGTAKEGLSAAGQPLFYARRTAYDPAGNLYVADTHRVFRIAPEGTLVRVAGGGPSDQEGIPAENAQFLLISGLAIDRGGNIYISDQLQNRVRKVGPNGQITTLAGTGQAGFSGDGGPAARAQLSRPKGLAVSAAGEVYIADEGNSRIRKVAVSGAISTVAGGGTERRDGLPATSFRMLSPAGVGFDASGTLHVAESERILKVAEEGTASTAAGGGPAWTAWSSDSGGPAPAAYLRLPQAVAFGPRGEMYIADTRNNRLAKVEGGVLSTVAGNGGFKVNADGVPAAGAWLTQPYALATSPAGEVYVADNSGGPARIQRIGRDGRLTLAAGNAFRWGLERDALALSLPGDVNQMSVDRQGNLYVAAGCAVWRVAGGKSEPVAGTVVCGFAGDGGLAAQARLSQPSGVAVHPRTGEVYIADSGNHRIRRVDATGVITSVAGTGEGGFSGDGGPAAQARLRSPGFLLFDAAGNLLIADRENNRIRRIDSGGNVQTIGGNGQRGEAGDGGPALSAQLPFLTSMALDGAGNLYLAGWLGRVRMITPQGQMAAVTGLLTAGFSGDGGPLPRAQFADPRAVAVDDRGNLYIADLNNDRVRVAITGSPVFSASPESLAFSGSTTGAAPEAQRVALSGSIAGLVFQAASSAPWIKVAPAQGILPALLEVTVERGGLAPGSYSGTITVTVPNATPSSRTVRVGFTLTQAEAPAPKLSLETASLAFTLAQGGGTASAQLAVSNAGGGTIEFAASAAGGSWLTVTPVAGRAAAGEPAMLTVTVDAGRLDRGVYTGAITIQGGGQKLTAPVTLTVAGGARILVSQSGLAFTAVAGGGTPAPQGVGVLNTGDGGLTWTATASTLSGTGWLVLDAASGKVDRPYLDVSLINVRVDARSLAPGEYYGRIDVAGAADNSPQTVTVILTVLPEGSNPGPEVWPSGLIFTGTRASGAASQDILVANRLAAPVTYNSGRVTMDGGTWLSSYPASATVYPGAPARLVVQPDYASLEPGVRRGVVTLLFDDGARTVNVLTVVAPPGSPDKADREAAGCASPNLRLEFTSLRDGFAAVLGQPLTVEVKAVDECGNLLTKSAGSGVDVFFAASNGDPDGAMTHIGNGVWTGTWRPAAPSSGQVTLTVTALLLQGRTAQAGRATRSGIVRASATPIVPARAVRHAATFDNDGPVAPGTLISVFGANLASAEGSAEAPLPLSLNDTEVALNGRPLPLLYVSASQLNAQVPYGLPVNTRHQLLVRRGQSLSVPEAFTVAAAQPGIFTKNEQGFGQGLIFKEDGATLAEPGTPASAGEEIAIYATGLGEVDPAVAAGEAAQEPAPRTVEKVSVTIGGVPAEVRFSGLAPGYAGRYLVRAAVPANVPAGDRTPVVVTAAGRSSQAATMAVR